MDGALVFKNENIAVARRMKSNITSFLILFDDLVNEGYEMKASDDIFETDQADEQYCEGSYFFFKKKN